MQGLKESLAVQQTLSWQISMFKCKLRCLLGAIHDRETERAVSPRLRGGRKNSHKTFIFTYRKEILKSLFRKVNADFRDDRKTIDDFHIARQIHEKCQEQKVDLYMALVNFTKNLNKVVRDLRRYGLSK